jgi:hypothetical protein
VADGKDTQYEPLWAERPERARPTGDSVDRLSTFLARLSSRRGFLGGLLRGIVGMGIALAYLGAGTAFADFSTGGIGCAPQGSGPGNHPGGTKGCGPPDKDKKYDSKDNCHWNGGTTSTGATDPSSSKYGCRPIAGGFEMCKDVGQTCGNQDPTKPGLPTCPGNTSSIGYWSCCCDLKGKGDKGTTYTVCLDCFPDPGAPGTVKKCTCLKAVPDGEQCKATP